MDEQLPPIRHQMPGGRRRALVGGSLGVLLGLILHHLTRRSTNRAEDRP